MNHEQKFFVTTGIPSLLLIFSVLVLGILSLLSLGVSRSDLRAGEAVLEQTSAYYEACSRATDFCISAREYLKQTGMEAGDPEVYFALAGDYFSGSDEALWDSSSRTATYTGAFSDSQALQVVLQVLYPEAGNACLEILSWNTTATGTWEANTRLPVFGS